MKRLHIHMAVNNIEQSINFYSALFHVQPTVQKENYAKWMLDDPRINFAISTQSESRGLNHLGIQVDTSEELESLRQQMEQANLAMFDQGKTVCCYAHSDKSWLRDPDGIAWETYHTMANAEVFSEPKAAKENTCCQPKATTESSASACGSNCC